MVDAKTQLVALVGHPVGHSLSPAMQNAAFQKLGLNFAYLAFDVAEGNLARAMQGMRALGIRGYSITLPHKAVALQFLDEIEPLAQKIGAVNTIVNDSGVLRGYNTDCSAAIESLGERTRLSGKKALLLGAGGAARAIAFGLKESGCDLLIANRTKERAAELAQALGVQYCGINEIPKQKFHILVNTTSVGMAPKTKEIPIGEQFLRKGTVVFDAVYNPLETMLLKKAKARGCKTIPGLEMFVRQGAKQFELWTGKKAPFALMEKVARQALQKGK
jgi:shikimate dehydrogenase